MPLYEYQCSACAHRFERIVKFSDAPLKICPQCGKATIEQMISAPAIQFKGSGWYVSDYARKSTPGSSGSAQSGSAKSEGGSDSASASKDSSGGNGNSGSGSSNSESSGGSSQPSASDAKASSSSSDSGSSSKNGTSSDSK